SWEKVGGEPRAACHQTSRTRNRRTRCGDRRNKWAGQIQIERCLFLACGPRDRFAPPTPAEAKDKGYSHPVLRSRTVDAVSPNVAVAPGAPGPRPRSSWTTDWSGSNLVLGRNVSGARLPAEPPRAPHESDGWFSRLASGPGTRRSSECLRHR